MQRHASLLLVIVSLAFTCAGGAEGANQVHVVDSEGGAGSDFTTIQSAMWLAAEGDLILIRPGQYGNVLVTKGLTLIGDVSASGHRPQCQSIQVSGTSAEQAVVLRGLGIVDHFQVIGLEAAVKVSNCAGPVVIEDVEAISGGSVYSQPLGAKIQNSPGVTFTRCVIRGAPSNGGLGHPARRGLDLINSTVALYETLVEGGEGEDAAFSPPFIDAFSQPGATGLRMTSGSTVIAVGSTIRGGSGGDGVDTGASCRPSSDGGVGLVVDGSVVRNDTVITGGSAGVDPSGCPSVGVDGVDVVITSGQIQSVNETLRSYHVDSPIRVGQPATTTYNGIPGEPVGLLLAASANPAYVAGLKGTFLLGSPLVFVSLGVAPASGQIQFSLPVPNILPGGIEGIVVHEQVVVPGQSGFGLLSSPTAVVIIDAAL